MGHVPRAGLVLEHAFGGRIRLPAWLRWLVTFHLVVFGWVLFRAQGIGTSVTVLSRLTRAGAPTLWTAPVVAADRRS